MAGQFAPGPPSRAVSDNLLRCVESREAVENFVRAVENWSRLVGYHAITDHAVRDELIEETMIPEAKYAARVLLNAAEASKEG